MTTLRFRTVVGRVVRAVALIGAVATPGLSRAQQFLVPMDDRQQNHLKAYRLTYTALKPGLKANGFLHYRGGSFLLPRTGFIASRTGWGCRECLSAHLSAIRASRGCHMEAVPCRRRQGRDHNPAENPLDDARSLALQYAGIEYRRCGRDVVRGGSVEVRLAAPHHEDFTGSPHFYIAYRGAPCSPRDRARHTPRRARSAPKSSLIGVAKLASRRARVFNVRDVRGELDARAGDRGHDVGIAGDFAIDHR